MTRVQRLSLGLAIAVGTVGLALVASTAMAAPIAPRVIPITVPDVGIAPEVSGLDAQSVLDPVEYQAVSDFTQRVTPFIHLDAAGVPRVSGASAADLGVDAAFLANFERALEFAYQAVEDGHIVLNGDLTVERGDAALPAVDGTTSGDPESVTDGAIVLPGAPGAGEFGDVPQWGTWNYPQGAMFYNSYLPQAVPLLIPPEAAPRFLFEYASELRRRFADQAWITLGSTWEGVLPGNEGKVYRAAAQLAPDIAATKAAGVKTIWLYCLEGVLFSDEKLAVRRTRAEAEAFFRTIVDTPASEPSADAHWSRNRSILERLLRDRLNFLYGLT